MDTGRDPRHSDRIINPDELTEDVSGHVETFAVNPDEPATDDVEGHLSLQVNPDTDNPADRVNPNEV